MVFPIGAAIAAAGSIIGGGATALGASSAPKTAAKTAAENNALQREIYDNNREVLNPYVQSGYGANSELNRLLGITPTTADGSPAGTSADWSSYLAANPDITDYYNANAPGLASMGFNSPTEYAQWHYANLGQTEMQSGARPQWSPQAAQPAAGGTGGAGGTVFGPEIGERPTFTRAATPTLDLSTAAYRESPGFQFQMDRGIGALKADRTLNGLLRSGSALKSALDFSQGLADQDYNAWADRATDRYYRDLGRTDQQFETDRAYGTTIFEGDRAYDTGRFDTRLNALMGQSSQGLSAGNALAGVGSSYAANTSANNNSAGSAAANATLAGVSSFNNLLGAMAYGAGNRGSSYGATQSPSTMKILPI